MKRIRSKLKYILSEQKSGVPLVINKNTTLYHGTSEQFKKENILPGAYDDIFWTTENANIAKTYIPVSGGFIYIESSHIVSPSKDPSIQDLQKKIGINYDYSKVKWEASGDRAESYISAPIFSDIHKKEREIFKKLHNIEDKIKEYKKIINDDNFLINYSKDNNLKTIITDLKSLESKKEELENLYHNFNSKKVKNEYVNKKLKEEYGYEPIDTNDFRKNYQWKIKVDGNEIKHADYRIQGRLFTIKPERDMTIYDMTLGGKREADLMDKDYHELSTFQWAKENNYDGIKITDFAQSEKYGNVMHTSIGFFKDAIKDLKVIEEEAEHPGEI